MANVLKLEPKGTAAALREDSPLTPELKDFIDRAIVPTLVAQYLPTLVAQYLTEIDLAKTDSDTAKSDSSTAALEPRTVRP